MCRDSFLCAAWAQCGNDAWKLQNIRQETLEITPTAAVPIYGRSADNIRDHRHVTSLLHRIHKTENGIFVKPPLSFDERGHKVNDMTYFVCGVTGDGANPIAFYGMVDEFLGEGGTFTSPRAEKARRDY